MSEENTPPQSSLVLYQTEDGPTRVQCRFDDGSIWLTQAQMAELFQTTPHVTLYTLGKKRRYRPRASVLDCECDSTAFAWRPPASCTVIFIVGEKRRYRARTPKPGGSSRRHGQRASVLDCGAIAPLSLGGLLCHARLSHLKAIFAAGDLVKQATCKDCLQVRRKGTIRKFRIVRPPGGRLAAREIEHYNLEAILAVGYGAARASLAQFRQRQRRCVTKPRVGARHERLPWDAVIIVRQPQRGCGLVPIAGSSMTTKAQPRWGWIFSDDIPRVDRRASGQPWALGRFPVGEEDGATEGDAA
jgi:hypothetical protein